MISITLTNETGDIQTLLNTRPCPYCFPSAAGRALSNALVDCPQPIANGVYAALIRFSDGREKHFELHIRDNKRRIVSL